MGYPRSYLVNAVLANPELYIRLVHRAELVFSCLVLWVLPWWAGLKTGARLTGVLIQAPVFFFKGIFQYVGWFGSDLLLVPTSIAAISIGAVLIHQRCHNHQKVGTLALMGLACGLGIASKLTFFPVVLLASLVCQGLRNWVTFAGSLLGTCAITFIPIYPRLPKIFDWIVALSIHSGNYGGGAVGLPPVGRYLSEISRLIQTEPCILTIPVAAGIAIGLCAIRLEL